MSGPLTPDVLMAKAVQASRSARLLLGDSDVDGACDRAYYAMFCAARAALLAQGVADPGKTHKGLLNLFASRLVKTGQVDKDLGRQFKRAEEMRIIADYTGEKVEMALAKEMVGNAENFVAAMQRFLD